MRYKTRKYTPEDCGTLADLFYNTVHSVNAEDYTEEQLAVWATGRVHLNQWNESFLAHYTLVAVLHEEIAGFGDIDESGYLDRLYVHKDHQGRGIATLLCEQLEAHVYPKEVTTHASITAKPFFIKRGYCTIQEQQVSRGGILLTNYIMVKRTA